MKKYLGIVKIYDEYMGGLNIKILSKFYDDIKMFDIWFNLYPNSEHIILNNTFELNSMFEIFEDMVPITQEEKNEVSNAKVLYKKLLIKE